MVIFTIMYKMIGESDTFIAMLEKIDSLSKIKRPILLIGERGSGKEAAAYRLSNLNNESNIENQVVVNCGALSESLIDSELFGHRKGAFTGATEERVGRFKEADKKDLFLDEIGLIPLSVQEKILRVVEYKEFYPLGSSKAEHTNVRIICATNSDLVELCNKGKFKKDLLDRLSFEVIHIPPLRYRGEDILLLSEYFAQNMLKELNYDIGVLVEFSDSLKNQLLEYSWPGNIRELKNVIERSVYRSKTPYIQELIINPFSNPYENIKKEPKASISTNFKEAQREFELLYLKRALKKNKGNQKQAALDSGLSYDQFRGLYRKYKDSLL